VSSVETQARSDRTADVVVLGAGAAGMAAALGFAAAGRDVLILEKQDPEAHTPHVRMSGGWLMTLDDSEAGARYLRACAHGVVDHARIDVWAGLATGMLEEWLAGLGVDLVDDGVVRAPEHGSLPGAESVRIRRAVTALPSPIAGQRGWFETRQAVGGEAVYRGLMHGIIRAGVETVWGADVRSLVRSSDDGRVTGVVFRAAGVTATVSARHGVVIATGGFGASPSLVRQHLDVPTTRFYGSPANDGGGLRLAVSAGAEIARMNRFVGRGIASFPTDGGLLGFMVDLNGGGYVICDQTGERYADEHAQASLRHDFYYEMQHLDSARGGYVRSPSYYLFDQTRFERGPMVYPDRGVCAVGLYGWSEDNGAELARGWIGTGATPSAAAAAVGAVPSPAFDASVADYNAGCATGRDRFDRPASSLRPLDRAPYYCLALHVGGPHTTGGPERDDFGRILGALDGRPIPGLFGAGELGQAIGVLYPAAGASLSEALCSGLAVAGEGA
jgi:glycine/D-amino acid oxidase-like deaminating enzyme